MAPTEHEPARFSDRDITILLRAAENACQASGYTWVQGPLTKFLRAGKPMPALPPSVVERFGDADAQDDRMYGWPDILRAAVHVVEAKGLPPHRVEQISVPDAITLLGRTLDQEVRRAAKEAERMRRSGRLENALAKGASWSWNAIDPNEPGVVNATLRIGSLDFDVQFSQKRDGTHWFAWRASPETERFLGAYDGRRTGLFPLIDGALREILADFMAKAKPNEVQIVGADQKRNDHNAGTYVDLTPPGYHFGVDRHDDGRPLGIRFLSNEPQADFQMDETTLALFAPAKPDSTIATVLGRLQARRAQVETVLPAPA